MKRLSPFIPFLIAMAVALPGTILRLMGVHLPPIEAVVTAGAAILGASFLLLWACDAAQADISQTLSLAVVALMAVLPEYAVSMYFTWEAGQHPVALHAKSPTADPAAGDTGQHPATGELAKSPTTGPAAPEAQQPPVDYAQYSVANMTGANRLLIGVAWGLIAVIFWFRQLKAVVLGSDRRLELGFLGLATLYAFIIPIKGTLAWYDGVVFLAMYVAYIAIASRRPAEESHVEGTAAILVRLPKVKRRLATLGLFVFAGVVILANAERFCEGLLATGRQLKISEFLLVQWLAPIASEAPEFIVAIMFAWRGQASVALGSLLSSKLNQWTLLIGMIPGVFAVSSWSLANPLPMDDRQMQEILLTAAQSLLAVILLASMRLSVSGALLLFTLFAGQLVLPQIIISAPWLSFGLQPEHIHPMFTAFYLVTAFGILLYQPWSVLHLLWPSLRRDAMLAGGTENPHCRTCLWNKDRQ